MNLWSHSKICWPLKVLLLGITPPPPVMPPLSLHANIPSPSNQLATNKEEAKDQSDDVIEFKYEDVGDILVITSSLWSLGSSFFVVNWLLGLGMFIGRDDGGMTGGGIIIPNRQKIDS